MLCVHNTVGAGVPPVRSIPLPYCCLLLCAVSSAPGGNFSTSLQYSINRVRIVHHPPCGFCLPNSTRPKIPPRVMGGYPLRTIQTADSTTHQFFADTPSTQARQCLSPHIETRMEEGQRPSSSAMHYSGPNDAAVTRPSVAHQHMNMFANPWYSPLLLAPHYCYHTP